VEKGFVGLRAMVFILIDAYPPESSYYVLNMHLSYGASFYCFLSVTIPVMRQTSFISHYTHYTHIRIHIRVSFISSALYFPTLVTTWYEKYTSKCFVKISWTYFETSENKFKKKHNIFFKLKYKSFGPKNKC